MVGVEMLAGAVPVAIEGMTTSSWLLVALNLLFGGGLVAGAIKVWPQLKRIASDERADQRDHRKDYLEDMRKRIGDLEREVKEAKETAHSSELKLVYAINAIQLLASKVRASDPDDPVLKHAMELLSAALTGGLEPWERVLDRNLPATREKFGKKGDEI